MANFIRYTEQQKEDVRNVDVIDFLGRYEGLTFKRAGNGYRCNEHNSLFIKADKMRWYWNSRSVGGNNIIDFLRDIKSMSFKEIMDFTVNDYLRLPNITPIETRAERKVDNKPKDLQLPKTTKGKYSRVFAYLHNTRGIDKDVINAMMKEKLIYQDERGNVVFVGKDKDGTPKFACVRGTLTDKVYRGDCSGSDKKYAFTISGTDISSPKVYVFEAPIDAMSHAAIIKQQQKAWRVHARLALSGTSDVALANYLTEHKHIKEIVFCLDSDSAGQEATDKYMKEYAKKGYAVSSEPPKLGKDYNDELLEIIGKSNTLLKEEAVKPQVVKVLDQDGDVLLLMWCDDNKREYYTVHRLSSDNKRIGQGKNCGIDARNACLKFCAMTPTRTDTPSIKGNKISVLDDGYIDTQSMAFARSQKGGEGVIINAPTLRIHKNYAPSITR